MATAAQEIALMKQRMDSMEDKLSNIDSKIDMLMEKLLDPDGGVTARVNQNTSARKAIARALWVLYAIVIGAIAKLIFGS